MNTTEQQTGYGKRLNQLTAAEMSWWHWCHVNDTNGHQCEVRFTRM